MSSKPVICSFYAPPFSGLAAGCIQKKLFKIIALFRLLFIIPVVGVLLGGLMLKEPITGNILIALALIGTGIFISQFDKKADHALGAGRRS